MTHQKKVLATSNIEDIKGHSLLPKSDWISPKSKTKKTIPVHKKKFHPRTAPALIVTGQNPTKSISRQTPTITGPSHAVGKKAKHSSLAHYPATKSKDTPHEDLEIKGTSVSNIRYFNDGAEITQSLADHE